MIKLKQLISENVITIYRGISISNRDGKFFTTKPEWARQFTQSGQDSEIVQCNIDVDLIYKRNPLPEATNPNDLDSAINEASAKGFKALWVDEGVNEPNSIFVIKKNILRNAKRYTAPL